MSPEASFSQARADALLDGAARRRVALPGRGVEIALTEWSCTGRPDAPIALLHHANGFCGAMWALFARHLRPHYRVVALDARGHGDSTAPPPGEAYAWIEFVHDLVALIEVLLGEERERGGAGRIELAAGNSFGGLVSAYAAARRPELFGRIAMLDPVLRPPPHLAAELLAGIAAVRPGFAAGENPMSAAARRRKQVWPSRDVAFDAWRDKEMFSRWAPGALDLYVAFGLRDRSDGRVELKCEGEIEASVFDATGILDLYAVADRIAAPVLLLRAGLGNFPMTLFEALAARIRDVKLLELEIDHLMPMHDTPELAAAVLDFATPVV